MERQLLGGWLAAVGPILLILLILPILPIGGTDLASGYGGLDYTYAVDGPFSSLAEVSERSDLDEGASAGCHSVAPARATE